MSLAGNIALWIDAVFGMLLVIWGLIWVAEKLIQLAIDYRYSTPILLQFARDYHGRKEAESKVKAVRTVTGYKEAQP